MTQEIRLLSEKLEVINIILFILFFLSFSLFFFMPTLFR
jgi:hypothetical protein